MLKSLISDFKLHKEDFLMPLLIVTISWLVGFGICCLIVLALADDGNTWGTLGTLMALFFLFFIALLFFAQYHQGFMLSLSMGRTRTEYMISYALRTLTWLSIGYGAVLVLYQVELLLGARLFAQYPLEVNPTFLIDWRYILLLIPGGTLLSMFIGALYSRFGKKGLIPFWFLWMAVCFIGPNMLPDEGEDPSPIEQAAQGILRFVGEIPAPLLIGLGIAAVGAMLATVIGLGKKQMVK